MAGLPPQPARPPAHLPCSRPCCASRWQQAGAEPAAAAGPPALWGRWTSCCSQPCTHMSSTRCTASSAARRACGRGACCGGCPGIQLEAGNCQQRIHCLRALVLKGTFRKAEAQAASNVLGLQPRMRPAGAVFTQMHVLQYGSREGQGAWNCRRRPENQVGSAGHRRSGSRPAICTQVARAARRFRVPPSPARLRAQPGQRQAARLVNRNLSPDRSYLAQSPTGQVLVGSAAG